MNRSARLALLPFLASCGSCYDPVDPPPVDPPPANPPVDPPAARPLVVATAAAVQFVAGNPAGNVKLLVKFEPSAQPGGKRGTADAFFETEDDAGNKVRLTDSGTGADAVADDGVWTGFATFDTAGYSARLAQWRSRYEAITPRPALPITDFREMYGEIELALEFVAPGMVALGKGEKGVEAFARTMEPVSLERITAAPVAVRMADFALTPEVDLDGQIVRLWPPDGLPAIDLMPPLRALSLIVTGVAPTTIPLKTEMVVNSTILTDPTRTYFECTQGLTTLPAAPPASAGTLDGVWSFKHAMEGIAGGSSPSAREENAQRLVWEWMNEWALGVPVATPRTNGQTVPPANSALQIQVLTKWRADSDALHPVVSPTPLWSADKLDLRVAPYRLIAIVNRLDLAGNSSYGGGDAGEGRLLFGLTNNNVPGCPASFNVPGPIGNPTPINIVGGQVIILEYTLPFSGCADNRNWAARWIALNDHELTTATGRAAYGTDLAAITETFVAAGVGGTDQNGSALGQLRTNDFVFNLPNAPNGGKSDWDMREFRLDSATTGARLDHVTVKQTPGETVTGANVNAWIAANQSAINNQSHEVPELYPGTTPFLGSYTSFVGITDARGANSAVTSDQETRHKFGINTCDGCHRAETLTDFLHVDPRGNPNPIPAGQTAFLSNFLTTAGSRSVPMNCGLTTGPGVLGSNMANCYSTTFVDPTIPSFSILDARASDLDARAQNTCLLDLPFLAQIQKANLSD